MSCKRRAAVKTSTSDRMSALLRSLEAQFQAVRLQERSLAQQNAALRVREEVLAGLINSCEYVAALCARLWPDGPKPLTEADGSLAQALVESLGEVARRMSLLIEHSCRGAAVPAAMHSFHSANEKVLISAVASLIEHQVQMTGPSHDWDRFGKLMGIYVAVLGSHKPKPQVPEEQHWRQVVAALHLSADQVAHLMAAWGLFKDSMQAALHTPAAAPGGLPQQPALSHTCAPSFPAAATTTKHPHPAANPLPCPSQAPQLVPHIIRAGPPAKPYVIPPSIAHSTTACEDFPAPATFSKGCVASQADPLSLISLKGSLPDMLAASGGSVDSRVVRRPSGGLPASLGTTTCGIDPNILSRLTGGLPLPAELDALIRGGGGGDVLDRGRATSGMHLGQWAAAGWEDAVGQAGGELQVERLVGYMSQLRHWALVLEVFLVLQVLSPLQAARLYVEASPYYPLAPTVFSTISAMHDEWQQRKGRAA